jgi:hypothetical protein
MLYCKYSVICRRGRSVTISSYQHGLNLSYYRWNAENETQSVIVYPRITPVTIGNWKSEVVTQSSIRKQGIKTGDRGKNSG